MKQAMRYFKHSVRLVLVALVACASLVALNCTHNHLKNRIASKSLATEQALMYLRALREYQQSFGEFPAPPSNLKQLLEFVDNSTVLSNNTTGKNACDIFVAPVLRATGRWLPQCGNKVSSEVAVIALLNTAKSDPVVVILSEDRALLVNSSSGYSERLELGGRSYALYSGEFIYLDKEVSHDSALTKLGFSDD